MVHFVWGLQVQHLETLLQMKEERIKDLTKQIETTIKLSTSPVTSLSGSRFFKNKF